jgi:hypothetical protein
MENIKIGDNCYLTEYTTSQLCLPEGVKYTIIDILEDDVDFQIVLNAEEFGKDWVQFFCIEELIII